MFKKFLWLIIAVVFLCSPLWALEDNPWDNVLKDYLFASAEQQQSSTPAQIKRPLGMLQPFSCSGPSRESASPTDICFNTNNCFDQVSFCLQGGFLSPGTQVHAFQDPGKVCLPVPGCPVYPFEVKNVHVLLTECDPAGTGAVAVVQPIIWAAVYPTDPDCPVPGNVICTGPVQQIFIDPLLCREYILPLDPNCCVNGPYFAGIRIITPGTPNLSLCLDNTCTPCCNYFDLGGGGPQEWCTSAPPPFGDFGMWTDGLYCCQSPVCGPCPPAPEDTLKNHYKTWRIITQPANAGIALQDQFQFPSFGFILDTIDFLSNPAVKDTSSIKRPDHHLTWYRGRISSFVTPKILRVEYVNQFESTKVVIDSDSLKYLLVPTQKDPHPRPDSLLGHYTAYKIRKPKTFKRPTPIQIQDQFDLAPELIDSLVPRYFLTPAIKNDEPAFGPDTHYVAYEIFPKGITSVTSVTTFDQFGPHFIAPILRSELLLVPSKKKGFVVCTHKPGDCNGNGTVDLADIICKVNVVFKGALMPVPNCRCDCNCAGGCTLTDIIALSNYIFKGGPSPQPCRECCKPL